MIKWKKTGDNIMKSIWEQIAEDAENEKKNKINYYKELTEEFLKTQVINILDHRSRTLSKNNEILLNYYLDMFKETGITLTTAYISRINPESDILSLHTYNNKKVSGVISEAHVILPKNVNYWPDVLNNYKVKMSQFFIKGE